MVGVESWSSTENFTKHAKLFTINDWAPDGYGYNTRQHMEFHEPDAYAFVIVATALVLVEASRPVT